jgi:hypothetical protein
MNVYEADKYCERHKVLYYEHFVTPATDRCHGTEDDPY